MRRIETDGDLSRSIRLLLGNRKIVSKFFDIFDLYFSTVRSAEVRFSMSIAHKFLLFVNFDPPNISKSVLRRFYELDPPLKLSGSLFFLSILLLLTQLLSINFPFKNFDSKLCWSLLAGTESAEFFVLLKLFSTYRPTA